MARQLHTLTVEETNLVNEFVEGGIAETPEEALQLLIDAGEITDGESSKVSYIPEGFKILKFSSGNSMNPYTAINDEAEEKGLKERFKKGRYYLGTKTPKKDNGDYDFDNFDWGIDVGASPKIVVTHILYNGSRFPINSDKGKFEGVTSTYALGMNFSHQKEMIDFNSKKSIYTLRQEQIKENNVKTYSELDKEAKIKFKTTIFGLVETSEGWQPFMLVEDQKYEDKDFLYNFNKDIKGKQKTKTLCEINLTPAKTESGVRYFMKSLEVKDDISADDYKETFSKLVMQNMKSVSKFLADQKESVKGTSENTQEKDTESEDDEQIDWD